MNLNYKSLISILGLQKWIDRLTSLETTVENLPTGSGDGNGIYDGSGAIPAGTLAAVTPSGVTTGFAVGVFPNFPDVFYDGSDRGLFISPGYYEDVMLINENSFISAGTSAAGMGSGSNSLLQVTPSEVRIQQSANFFSINTGQGSPEGVIIATVGSMYLRTDGGTGTTLYIKESGTGNTGWVAK
jgi:hypothetical protein